MSTQTERAPMSRNRLILCTAALLCLAACKETTIPNYNSPVPSPSTQGGVQLLVTGVFTATRIDAGYLSAAASSFARDFCNFTNSDDRFLTMWCGDGLQISDNTFYGTGGWPNVFRAARSANLVLSALPTVSPAYSAADQAAIAGVLYTMKALNFMNLAEYRDTLGVPIGDLTNTNINNPAPILCNPDVWAYIVALLDSGNADLNTGGAAMPLTLPGGFAAVSMLAGPSTTAGGRSRRSIERWPARPTSSLRTRSRATLPAHRPHRPRPERRIPQRSLGQTVPSPRRRSIIPPRSYRRWRVSFPIRTSWLTRSADHPAISQIRTQLAKSPLTLYG